jgi:dihydroflavonol-4-reductase
MTRVLVTGGSGFIGQHLVSALVSQGRAVHVLDVRKPGSVTPDVQYIEGSVLDAERLDQAMREVEQVYHLAGLPGMWLPDKNNFHAVNCVGTEMVLAAARKHCVARFLHCSTESILFRADPGDGALTDEGLQTPNEMPGPYTRSKLRAEQLAIDAAATGLPVVIGSPTMPIGPHDGNLTPPAEMLKHFLGGGLHFYLDFIVNLVDVRDVAAGLILAMERGQFGQRYVLGGESIPLKQVLAFAATVSGRQNLLVPLPGRVAEVVAGMLELVADHVTRRPPSGTAEGVRIALRATALSIEKARRELGFNPGPIEPALRETVTQLLGA